MNGVTLPTPTARPVVIRILRCIGLLGALVARNLGVHYRRVFRPRLFGILDQPRLLYATPLSLLRGCVADLGNAFSRMERRFDALPELWTFEVGPCFQRDSTGNLQPNTDSDARMTGIENFQKDRPKATLFDAELFLIGWEAGAKYASGKSCSGGSEGKSCNPPDRNSIPDSPGDGPVPGGSWVNGVISKILGWGSYRTTKADFRKLNRVGSSRKRKS